MDLSKITHITKIFPHLCGLRLLPISMIFFLVAAKESQILPELAKIYFIGFVAGLGLCTWLIHLYYINTYGKVVPENNSCCKPVTRLWDWIFLTGCVVAVGLEIMFDMPVSVFGLMMGYFVIYYVFIYYPRPYSIPFAFFAAFTAICIITAHLGFNAFPDEKAFEISETGWSWFAGICLFVGGILDHVYINQIMNPAGESQYE